jgi:hypothetical protein
MPIRVESNRHLVPEGVVAVERSAAQFEILAPPPIIVLGARPTNTAILGAMLGCNRAAFAFPQLNLFLGDTVDGVVTATTNQGPTQMHGLLRAVAYLYGSEQTIIAIGMARRWLMRRMASSTRSVFDELRRLVAPRRLVDKSALYSHDAKSLDRIREAAPDAYYVHVVEHPLATSAAIAPFRKRSDGGGRRKRGARLRTVSHGQLQWLEAQRLIAGALNYISSERITVLRMENLLDDARVELSELCGRLDLPNEETTVTEMLHPENSPFACFGPVGANLGDDLTFLRDPTFPPTGGLGPQFLSHRSEPRMLPEVAAVAARYGYG